MIECSAQGQVFHYKLRHQGWSSAQRQVFLRKLRNQGCSLLGMNSCDSFPLLSALHSLFGIWTDLKKSEKIPGAPTWRRREWIRLTGSFGLHRISPQGLNFFIISIDIVYNISCFCLPGEMNEFHSSGGDTCSPDSIIPKWEDNLENCDRVTTIETWSPC